MRFDGLPRKVQVREVGPRDGFQSVRQWIPTDRKLAFVEALLETGITDMEAASFVSPKAIPQMADGAEIVRAVKARHPNVRLTALVPNVRGAENALAAGVDVLNAVFSASESHNRANINRTVEQSLEGLKELAELAAGRAELSVSIATAFQCPFEGRTDPGRVVDLIGRVRELGVKSICLAETIGTCHPVEFSQTLEAVRPALGDVPVYLHIHDTLGMALLNVKVALDMGFWRFDSAVGGLGGCPFAPGAAGNVATEDLVFFLAGLGIETGLDPLRITAVARQMKEYGLNTMGHLAASNLGQGECSN